jgi:hypothetical protein
MARSKSRAGLPGLPMGVARPAPCCLQVSRRTRSQSTAFPAFANIRRSLGTCKRERARPQQSHRLRVLPVSRAGEFCADASRPSEASNSAHSC